MSQHYGNSSRFMNFKRISGLSINKSADITGYLTTRQLIRKQRIAENNKIDMLLKQVKEHPLFIKDLIHYQESIKYFKGADSLLKNILIDEIQDCQNDCSKIIKILKTIKREL